MHTINFNCPAIGAIRNARRQTVRNLYENNLLSERHIRYGGYGGIAYYHVSDTSIALFSHFIPCGVWETVYILDGLTKNKSDIQPDTLVPLAGKNKLYFAFRELGRVVRTMFLLEYISDDALLQVILAAQNK